MKRLLSLIILTLVSIIPALAGESFADYARSLWFSGHKDQVLVIAKQRLVANSTDIAGLILKMEYEVAYLDTNHLPATLNRLEAVGKNTRTPNFKDAWPQALQTIRAMRAVLSSYTPSEIANDRKNADMTKQPMPLFDLLRAAEADGLIPTQAK